MTGRRVLGSVLFLACDFLFLWGLALLLSATGLHFWPLLWIDLAAGAVIGVCAGPVWAAWKRHQ